MNQNEFEQLSFERCKSLNGKQDNKAVLEAWRDGYIYLKRKIAKMSETMYNDEFTHEVMELCSEELDSFSGNQNFVSFTGTAKHECNYLPDNYEECKKWQKRKTGCNGCNKDDKFIITKQTK